MHLDVEYLGLVLLFAGCQRRLAGWLLSRWTLPRRRVLALLDAVGLYAHELTHGLVALLLGGRPSYLTVLPRRDGWTFQGLRFGVGTQGAVIHCTRPSLSPLVDAAPLLLLPLALYLPDSLPLAIRAWFGAQLLRYGTPSRHDLRQLLPAALVLAATGYGVTHIFL